MGSHYELYQCMHIFLSALKQVTMGHIICFLIPLVEHSICVMCHFMHFQEVLSHWCRFDRPCVSSVFFLVCTIKSKTEGLLICMSTILFESPSENEKEGGTLLSCSILMLVWFLDLWCTQSYPTVVNNYKRPPEDHSVIFMKTFCWYWYWKKKWKTIWGGFIT